MARHDVQRVAQLVEEIVDEELIRSDPNRTLIPGLIVDAVVAEPYGAHPSYAQGYYDRDNVFYVEWEDTSRSVDATSAYLDEWVYGVSGRAEYMEKHGPTLIARLRPEPAPSPPVDYGIYR